MPKESENKWEPVVSAELLHLTPLQLSQVTTAKGTACEAAIVARYRTKAQRAAAEAVRVASEAAAERRFNEAMTRKMAELRRSQLETRAKLERQASARTAEAERAAAAVARRRADEAEGLVPTTLQAIFRTHHNSEWPSLRMHAGNWAKACRCILRNRMDGCRGGRQGHSLRRRGGPRAPRPRWCRNICRGSSLRSTTQCRACSRQPGSRTPSAPGG